MSEEVFRELGVSAPVVAALAARSIEHPFRIQELVLPTRSRAWTSSSESPTGSGKTLAFAIPIVERTDAPATPRPSALVLVPDARARRTGDRRDPAARQGQGPRGRGLRLRRRPAPGAGASARKGAHILVATPGRLEDLAAAPARRSLAASGSSSSTRPTACSTWASSRRSTRSCAGCPRNRQTMFFSATLDGEVGELARAYTNSPSRFEAELSDDAAPARSSTTSSRSRPTRKVETLVEHIRDRTGSTLVFVRTKRGADRLVQQAQAARRERAAAMHGDMSQNARERALAQLRERQGGTLVATDVAARGLDVDGHHARDQLRPARGGQGLRAPHGRTGRAGRSGIAITFVLPEQQAETSRVASRLGPSRAVRAGRDDSPLPRSSSTRAAAAAARSGNHHGLGRRAAEDRRELGGVDVPARDHADDLPPPARPASAAASASAPAPSATTRAPLGEHAHRPGGLVERDGERAVQQARARAATSPAAAPARPRRPRTRARSRSAAARPPRARRSAARRSPARRRRCASPAAAP